MKPDKDFTKKWLEIAKLPKVEEWLKERGFREGDCVSDGNQKRIGIVYGVKDDGKLLVVLNKPIASPYTVLIFSDTTIMSFYPICCTLIPSWEDMREFLREQGCELYSHHEDNIGIVHIGYEIKKNLVVTWQDAPTDKLALAEVIEQIFKANQSDWDSESNHQSP